MSCEEQFGTYIVDITPHESKAHGACIQEEWRLGANLHRIGKPAITITSLTTGKIVEEGYYVDDLYHREDGPAVKRLSPTGIVELECWFLNGEEHRENGPETVFRHPETGKILSEGWSLNGKTHRVDGPAYVNIDSETGVVVEEDWMQHGEYYREDGGPVLITRDAETGEVTRESRQEDLFTGDAPDLPDSDPSP